MRQPTVPFLEICRTISGNLLPAKSFIGTATSAAQKLVFPMSDVPRKLCPALSTSASFGLHRPARRLSPRKWRKVKVKLQPPPGLPQLTVHARSGSYASLR